MSNDICVRRLTKELRAMKKDPITNPKITVAPNEANILEMHYVRLSFGMMMWISRPMEVSYGPLY